MDGLTRRILLGVALGIVVALGFMLYGDVDALIESLSSFDVWVLVPATGVVLVGYGIRAFKWELYLRHLGYRVPPVESGLVFFSGLAMGVTPGKLGELLKSLLLKRSRGLPMARTAPIVIAERLTDLMALLLLASFGAASTGYGVAVVVVGTSLVVVALGVISSPRASHAFLRQLARLPGLKRLAPRVEEAYDAMAKLVGPGPLLAATALSVVAWSGEALATYWILQAFPGVEVSLGQATFVYAFATVAGALSMLPGGLVAAEGSMIALVTVVFPIAPSKQVATAATLLVRFCTLWLGVAVGALALLIHQRRYTPDVTPPPGAEEPPSPAV